MVPVVKEITEAATGSVHEPEAPAVPSENFKNSNEAKGFGSDFRYLLIVSILIAAVFWTMIRLQLMILEKIKAVSDMLKRFCGSEKTDGDGKSVHLKLIKGKN